MNVRGYFVKGTQVVEISGTTHVRYVLDNPGVFGMDRNSLIMIYRQYHEPIGFEGKARRAILMQLLGQGWVRVRETRGRMCRWPLELNDYDLQREHVQVFLGRLQNEGVIDANDTIVIRELGKVHGEAVCEEVFTMG